MTFLQTYHRRTLPDAPPTVHPADCRLYDRLPFGALLVDDEGRILEHTPLDWMPGHPRHHDIHGVDFFRELCAGTPLELWGDVFRGGIRGGELYRFVTLTFQLGNGPKDVTFLFYYHQQTGEAWIFIDPRPQPAFSAPAGRMAA